MAYRYTTEERVFGGSMSPRLNPKIADTQLNAKIGGKFPSPVASATDTGMVPAHDSGRKARINMPDRFKKY